VELAHVHRWRSGKWFEFRPFRLLPACREGGELMGLFDGMTQAEIRAMVREQLQADLMRRPLRPHDFGVLGELGPCIAVALGWREAAWAMDFWRLPGALALGSWRAMRRIKLPASVREVILVTAAAELGEARHATWPLRQTGISTQIKIHTPSPAPGPCSLAEANQRVQQEIERERENRRRRSPTYFMRDDSNGSRDDNELREPSPVARAGHVERARCQPS
jgi:hypothetical protein